MIAITIFFCCLVCAGLVYLVIYIFRDYKKIASRKKTLNVPDELITNPPKGGGLNDQTLKSLHSYRLKSKFENRPPNN